MAEGMELSRPRLVALCLLVAGVFIDWGLLLSLLPPFYPTEAEKKGATPAQYGFVFGMANLAAFLTAPIFAKFGDAIGPKLLINLGGFIQGSAGIAFAFVDLAQSTPVFLGLSYLLRFLDGAADAAAWGAVLAIMMKVFPDHVTTVMAWTETFFGLGYTIGPGLGSLLYELGGFSLPFLVVGALGLVLSGCLFFVLPKRSADESRRSSKDSGDSKSSGSFKPLTLMAVITTPSISIPFLDNSICFMGIGFLESMLEPHMKKVAEATQFNVSMTFLTLGLVYMVSSPLFGWICDKMTFPVILSLIGNVLICLGLFFIGPLPGVPFHPSVTFIILACAVHSLGYSNVMVSSFGRAFNSTLRLGYEDDISTYIMISGMWSSSFYLGSFLGPTISGFIVEWYGFRISSAFFFTLTAMMIVVDSIELWLSIKNGKGSVQRGYELL